MHGLHLTADLHDCQCAPAWFTEAALLGERCARAVEDAGLNAVARLFHAFASTAAGPGGVTATLLLAESHLCIHTWPELRAATLDVYVCNFGADRSAAAHALMDVLVALFEPRQVERHAIERGALRPQPPGARSLPTSPASPASPTALA